MKVIDKLRCPVDYSCGHCNNYDKPQGCIKEHSTCGFSDLGRKAGWFFTKRVLDQHLKICYSCEDYEEKENFDYIASVRAL